MPEELSAKDVQHVIGLVLEHCKRPAALYRVRWRLAYDLTAVLCGARPAALLDYVVVELQQLVGLLDAVGKLTRVQCCVLSLDDCHFISTVRGLQRHLDAAYHLHSQPALLKLVPGAGGQPTDMAVMVQEEVQVAMEALQPLHIAVQAEMANTAAGSVTSNEQVSPVPVPAPPEATATATNGGTTTASSTPSKPLVLDLMQLPGLPLMPTLNGWLLSYPIVYHVASAQEAQQTSRYLSSTSLTLFQMCATCTPVEEAMTGPQGSVGHQGRQGSQNKGRQQYQGAGALDGVMCAFSVPSHLLGEGGVLEGCVERWAEATSACLGVHRDIWQSGCLVSKSVGIRAVSL